MNEAFKKAFEQKAVEGELNYIVFTSLALYDPEIGYYTTRRKRVGKSEETDFYTAATLHPTFHKLVVGSLIQNLGEAYCKESTLVEIGAEENFNPWENIDTPFRAIQRISVADELKLSGQCVVVANELFDAQPFLRCRFTEKGWRELGIRLEGDSLSECLFSWNTPEFEKLKTRLPKDAPIGYTIDYPTGASLLLHHILEQDWQGAVCFFDYGHTRENLYYAFPEGTARGYYKHRQVPNLLHAPGEMDLTCHVCWDDMKEAMAAHSFENINVQAQESFFVHNAQSVIEQNMQDENFKRQMMELLHPGHLGRKFQVLYGKR